jgi:uncharacterized protein (UPF0303 family)
VNDNIKKKIYIKRKQKKLLILHIFDYHTVLKKKRKNKDKTMDFLTNKRNTDTCIRIKIKMIQYDTNTCLISVAPLRQPFFFRPSPGQIVSINDFIKKQINIVAKTRIYSNVTEDD